MDLKHKNSSNQPSSSKPQILLLGGGGHCKSCIDVIEQEGKYEIAGILDSKAFIGQTILGYTYLGTDDEIEKFVKKGYSFLITVGQIKTASVRKKLFSLLERNHASIATVISPRAYVSTHAKIGIGSIVMHDALVNATASIGKNCIF